MISVNDDCDDNERDIDFKDVYEVDVTLTTPFAHWWELSLICAIYLYN